MLQKTFTGRTVEEAVQLGLSDMFVTENQVKIEVIKPGKKGLLGFGQSDAEVNLIIIDPELKKLKSLDELKQDTLLKEHSQPAQREEASDFEQREEQFSTDARDTLAENAEKTADYIKDIIKAMNIDVTSECLINGNKITIELFSADAARIIGKRGQTLNALQVFAQTYFQHIQKSFIIVTLDIENYRFKRKETLQKLALNMSKKAKVTKQPVKFEPMPSYERKIMHQILAEMKDIETYSEGREPNRYLVIKAK
ncbi:protein jag [Macrococcus lamae]|uniref:RNA-binding protein KhpB n=1 Tax=Macrococcus lamae TaxID=198484 RepID=A0A4R6BTL0_9STAP|nr:protein jag [Macrococcus lamae]